MFKLTTKGSEGWKNILGLMFSLNDESVISISDKGLDFKVMDIDRSGLVDFIWSPENMTSFKCDGEQKVGIRNEDFKKIMARASSSDDITITHDGDGVLKIDIGDKKSYDMRLVETDMISTGSKPKVEYNFSVDVPHSILKEKVSDMLIIGVFMTVTIRNGEIEFKVTGEHVGKTIHKDESIKVDNEMSGRFSISHLDNALKCINKVDTVKISAGTNYPLCLSMDLKDAGIIKYYLAPYTGGND